MTGHGEPNFNTQTIKIRSDQIRARQALNRSDETLLERVYYTECVRRGLEGSKSTSRRLLVEVREIKSNTWQLTERKRTFTIMDGLCRVLDKRSFGTWESSTSEVLLLKLFFESSTSKISRTSTRKLLQEALNGLRRWSALKGVHWTFNELHADRPVKNSQ